MEINLIKEINIGDKTISHFTIFSIQQSFNEHHYFELKFNHDQTGAPRLITLDDSRDFIGKILTASIGREGGPLQNFAGIVTKVELTQSNGYHGILVISGYSPTILIDRGADLGSYLDKSLNDIVSLATHDTPANDLRIVTNATRKTPIDYVIQYRESDWEFLNRLSGEYYEWFFYDGVNLNFGKPDKQQEMTLFYGRDINSLQYGLEVAPIKNKRFSYNPKENEMLQSESTGKANGRPDLVHAINASNIMYSKTFNQSSSVRVDNQSDIKSQVDNEELANISNLIQVTGVGDNPMVSIGSIVDITMSLKKESDFSTESLGKFLITSIHHTIDERGHYQNRFEGLVSTTERLLVTNYRRPNPDMQLADVVDNNDPQNNGRVKVKFKWACQTNNYTEWLRVITPDAGSSENVSKNRGFAFVPEKGDQVVIAFEEGNIARPIVLGSVFHGNNNSGGSSDNKIKSIATRSGNKLQMDDSDGSINLMDKGSANLSFDGAGNAIMNAANSKTINVGGDKDNPPQSVIKADAEGNIILEAKTSITLKVGDNLLSIDKDGLIKLNGKDLKQTLENNYDLDAKRVTQNAKGANFKINSDQNVIVSGGIEVKLK